MKSNNFSNTIAACVLFGILGTSAFAADKAYADGDTSWQFDAVSTKTRTQVINELKESGPAIRLVQDGVFEYAHPRVADVTNGRSRAEVQAEAGTMTRAASDITTNMYFGG